MPYELYHTLGIPPSASPDEVKRAFYGLVREHSPERDPEKYKVLREAYETLRDPKSRANYDSTQEYGGEIAAILEAAEAAAADEDWAKAEQYFKRALVLNPASDGLRNQLGLALLHQEKTQESVRVFSLLVEHEPDVGVYWTNLGEAQALAGQGMQAIESFRRAIALEPYNAHPYICIANVHVESEEYSAAIDWLEKTITADNKTDFQDFDALFKMAIVHLMAGDLEKIVKVAERIRSLVSELPQADEYVAARFIQVAVQLLEFRAYRQALFFAQAAKRFRPHDRRVVEFEHNCLRIVNAFAEWEPLERDQRIVAPIKALVALDLTILASGDVNESDVKQAFELFRLYHASDVLSSVETLRNHYPSVYGLAAERYDALVKNLHQAKARSSSSCALVALPVCISILSYLVYWLAVSG